jgi:hypothetical protein
VKKAERRELIVKIYAKLAKELERYPARSDLIQAGVSRDQMRDAFGDMDALKQAAREAFPKNFENIIDPDFYNDEAFRELQAQVKKFKRFVVTTAVAGAPVDDNFYGSLKKYCELRKALLLVLPANYSLYDIDPDLVRDELVVFRGVKLNSNVSISVVKIDPKQVDPSQGLDTVGQREGTILIGSPKQRRRPVANSNTKHAHIIQATGAITKPRYIPRDGERKRRDFLAEKQHVTGAVIVEIEDDKIYHFRAVQAKKDGSFNDLFHNYSEEGSKFVGCEAIVQGDYHNDDTDPTADAVADELCKLGQPRFRVLHDFFDGKSINHHERRNKVLRAIQAGADKLSLEKELRALKATLEAKLKLNTCDKIVISKSNHDEFLDRYLAEGEFDDQNRIISARLQILAMEGKDPLKAGLEELLGFKGGDRVIWLERDQDFKVAGVELGAHGDLGSNGSRNPGSNGMLKAYGDCVYGHCHYGEINHGAWSVGTSSFRKLGYNRGPSSWEQVHAIIYKDGTRQLINSIDGRWRLKD